MKICSTLLIIKEIKSKITLKYHFSPTSKNTKSDNRFYGQCSRETGTYLYYFYEWNMVEILNRKNLSISLKKTTDIPALWPYSPHIGLYPTNVPTCVCKVIHYRWFVNSKRLDTIPDYINVPETIACQQNGVLCGHKKRLKIIFRY